MGFWSHSSIDSAVMRPDIDSWSPEKPCHAVVGQLLKFLLVMNWDEIPVVGEMLEGEISQALEKDQGIVSFRPMGLKGCG